MIHRTPEGQQLHTGLNWYINWSLKRFWFRLIWISVDLPTKNYTNYYFRFRAFLYPFIIMDKTTSNIIDNWITMERKVILTHTEFEDILCYIPKWEKETYLKKRKNSP
jgi:hypothetical protein